MCTRCVVGDLSRATLLVRREDPFDAYEAHDLAGAYVITLMLSRERRAS